MQSISLLKQFLLYLLKKATFILKDQRQILKLGIVMAACMANDYHNNMDLHCLHTVVHIGVALIIPHNLPKTSTVDFNDGK